MVSKDGKRFSLLTQEKSDTPVKDDEVHIKTVSSTKKQTGIRYVKLIAKTLGPVPEWHKGYPYQGRSWIFVDEIAIR